MRKLIIGLYLIGWLVIPAFGPAFGIDTTEKIQNRLEKQEALSQKRFEKKRVLLEKKYQRRLKKLQRWHEKELKQIAYEEKIMKEKLDTKKEKLGQP